MCIPQGGVKRRPGMAYLGTGLGDGRIENFSFSVEQSYLLVFTDLKVQIYKEGVLQTNINGSGNDWLATPWTLAQLQDIDYIQSADTAIVVHPDVEPKTISRTGDTSWSVDPVPLINIPQFNFDDASSPTPTSEIQDILIDGIEQGSTVRLSLEGISTDDFSYEGANSDMATAIEENLQALPNTGDTGITCTFQSGTEFNSTFRVTFADDSAKDWRLLNGILVSGTITGDETITGTRIQAGTGKQEDVWSATRGWPNTATFHEGRLWFGGSPSLPASLWGSKVNSFFNFDEGKARDDELVFATLDTDQVNAIRGIFSNRSLQVFTSGAEFYVPESPITPSNISVQAQTNLGSKRVRPVSIDGVSLFVQRTGKSVNQFVFLEAVQANQTRSITTANPSLISSPIKMATAQGSEKSDANYVYILNDNGDMTVFNTLIAENVQGLTQWETEGDIKSIAVVDSRLYFLVERDGSYFVEREDDDLNTDSGVRSNVGGSDTLTGLAHLNGETVRVKADNAVQEDETVSGGQIVIGRDADIIEAGLNYTPTIQTMPLNVSVQKGPNYFAKKKIARVALSLFESNGIIVNNQRLADRTIGVDQFDPPIPQTGTKRVHILGWSLDASVTITQDNPYPMVIRSIGMEIKAS